jgi:hypothetical protein
MAIKKYTREVDRKPGDPKSTAYSRKQKYQAVSLYKLLGSLREVSKQTQIPYDRLKHWHLEDWWKEMEAEISLEARTKRSKKLEKIVEMAATVVEDRLKNGEHIITKGGDLRRVPVKAQVANKIMQDSIDRQLLMEKLQKEEVKVENDEKIDTRLAKLFSAFLDFSKAKTIESSPVGLAALEGGDLESTAVEAEYAIHEERQTGLQAGEQGVQLQAGSDQEEGPEEQGPPRCD